MHASRKTRRQPHQRRTPTRRRHSNLRRPLRIGLQVSDKATLAALSGTNKTAHDANAQALAAAHAQHLQELAAAARSLDHICEYWACQQGTGHHQTGQTCPSCGSTNTWEYDGTRTSYDYCKQCNHEWNRWYD